jgi:hypothetical protein
MLNVRAARTRPLLLMRCRSDMGLSEPSLNRRWLFELPELREDLRIDLLFTQPDSRMASLDRTTIINVFVAGLFLHNNFPGDGSSAMATGQ